MLCVIVLFLLRFSSCYSFPFFCSFSFSCSFSSLLFLRWMIIDVDSVVVSSCYETKGISNGLLVGVCCKKCCGWLVYLLWSVAVGQKDREALIAFWDVGFIKKKLSFQMCLPCLCQFVRIGYCPCFIIYIHIHLNAARNTTFVESTQASALHLNPTVSTLQTSHRAIRMAAFHAWTLQETPTIHNTQRTVSLLPERDHIP